MRKSILPLLILLQFGIVIFIGSLNHKVFAYTTCERIVDGCPYSNVCPSTQCGQISSGWYCSADTNNEVCEPQTEDGETWMMFVCNCWENCCKVCTPDDCPGQNGGGGGGACGTLPKAPVLKLPNDGENVSEPVDGVFKEYYDPSTTPPKVRLSWIHRSDAFGRDCCYGGNQDPYNGDGCTNTYQVRVIWQDSAGLDHTEVFKKISRKVREYWYQIPEEAWNAGVREFRWQVAANNGNQDWKQGTKYSALRIFNLGDSERYTLNIRVWEKPESQTSCTPSTTYTNGAKVQIYSGDSYTHLLGTKNANSEGRVSFENIPVFNKNIKICASHTTLTCQSYALACPTGAAAGCTEVTFDPEDGDTESYEVGLARSTISPWLTVMGGGSVAGKDFNFGFPCGGGGEPVPGEFSRILINLASIRDPGGYGFSMGSVPSTEIPANSLYGYAKGLPQIHDPDLDKVSLETPAGIPQIASLSNVSSSPGVYSMPVTTFNSLIAAAPSGGLTYTVNGTNAVAVIYLTGPAENPDPVEISKPILSSNSNRIFFVTKSRIRVAETLGELPVVPSTRAHVEAGFFTSGSIYVRGSGSSLRSIIMEGPVITSDTTFGFYTNRDLADDNLNYPAVVVKYNPIYRLALRSFAKSLNVVDLQWDYGQ